MEYCEDCDQLTGDKLNDYNQCRNCADNAAEAAHEAFLSDFYGGSEPVTLKEKQGALLEKLKREGIK